MKLNVSLDALWSNVHRMGAKTVSVDMDISHDNGIDIDAELSSGIEIDIKDLDITLAGVLSVKGRQVLLFISDHGHRVASILADSAKGNRFHIADCSTLQEMRRGNRFERYHVTNNLSGEFEVFGTDQFKGKMEGKAKLNVCKNCLNQLNYKRSANLAVPERNRLVQEFDVGEFFSCYSSLFKFMPKQAQQAEKGYSEDWKEISAEVRRSASYVCESCNLNLSQHKRLLHVHHKDGVKHNNSRSNLAVLCIDCHRKEPHHQHMFIKHHDTQLINQLRREQSVIRENPNDWSKTYEFADPAVHGILNHAQKRNIAPPEIGYPVQDNNGEIIAELELAWPEVKFGVFIEEPKKKSDWNMLNMQQAMQHFSQKR
ncbi:HNH endonuclease [Pelagibaculum spongiae]|uniref:HNH endonuclease n=1 Tax=Pelagibaculum spongiae TaxID=2080658 RepID=UPI000E314657|nr:HNH endonuclease signature motif containing protein [Pelagibaculum spongiae]